MTSLDNFRALGVEELVAAIGAEELDFLVPEFLRVAIKFALALRTGYPKNLRHDFLLGISPAKTPRRKV